MKLTYRHSNHSTRVTTPGFGKLFFISRRGGRYSIVFNCQMFGDLTGTDADLKAFCQWLAPTAMEILTTQRAYWANAIKEDDDQLGSAVEALKSIGIEASVDMGVLRMMPSQSALLAKFIKEVK